MSSKAPISLRGGGGDRAQSLTTQYIDIHAIPHVHLVVLEPLLSLVSPGGTTLGLSFPGGWPLASCRRQRRTGRLIAWSRGCFSGRLPGPHPCLWGYLVSSDPKPVGALWHQPACFSSATSLEMAGFLLALVCSDYSSLPFLAPAFCRLPSHSLCPYASSL